MGGFAQQIYNRDDAAQQDQLKFQIAPLSQALQADQTRLALYADPNDPSKAVAGKEKEYEATLANMTNTIGQMRDLLGQREPHHSVLDSLHIRRDLQNRIAQWKQKNQQMAGQFAQGSVPFEMTPEGQKAAYQRQTEIDVANARYTPSLKLYRLKDGTTEYLDSKHPENIPEGAQPVSITSTNPHVRQVAGPDGKPVWASEMGGKFYDQSGKEIPDAKPYVKPAMQQPKAGVSNGRNVFALLTDKGWVDAGTKQPLPDFRPAPTFAQMGLGELATMQDGGGNFHTVMIDRRTGRVMAGGDSLVDPKIMSEVNKSLEPARDADTRYRIMADNEAAALSGDQQAMLSLVANHIGMTLGQQKGSRINQAVWNEAVESAPWLSRVKARFDPNSGVLSGVTLAPEQIEQMVDLARDRRMRQWQQAQQTGAQYGVDVKMPTDLDNPSLEGPRTKQLKSAATNARTGGGEKYIYAKDPQGNVHRAKQGTPLPKGWTLTNGPSR